MKSKANPFLQNIRLVASTAAVLASSSAHAVDYGFGSVTENFTITATDQARVMGAGITASSTLSPDNGAVYDRGSDQDATYMHFNLASLAGATINGNVNLNFTVNTQWGGDILNGIIGTATSTWTTNSATPGITAFTPVAAPNQTYANGATATWTIGNSDITSFVADYANFKGLGITAGNGSNAHFSALATLTGEYTGGAVRVIGGTNWDAAAYDGATKVLSLSGGVDASGGNVILTSGTKLNVTGSATLGTGNFAGTFANSGTLAFGSSANQTLAGVISGSGNLEKSGAGTLTLAAANTYSGTTTVNEGTLELPGGDWVTGNPWSSGGATGAITVGSGATLSTSAGVTQIKNGLTLNGGTVSSRGLTYGDAWSNLYLGSDVTAGGAAISTIASQIVLNGSRTFTLLAGSTLNVDGKVTSWDNDGSGITKIGTGTLKLSGANSYTGATDISVGTLIAANHTALGTGGWNGATMTTVRDGATLALQGGITLDEHMHIVGAGVDGAGALRSLSGNNTLSMTNGGSGSGPGLAIDGNTTVGVDAERLTVSGFYHDDVYAGSGITKVGAGTLELSSSSTYTGATTVSAGTLLVNGDLGNTAVTVGANGTIGGSGTIAGSLNFDAGAKLTVNLADPLAEPLAVSGAVTFDGFDFNHIVGWDYTNAANGIYTLLAGNVSLTNVAHVGSENAFSLGGDRAAYFQSGSLQVVVIPEPRAALLGGLGLLALLRRRRG